MGFKTRVARALDRTTNEVRRIISQRSSQQDAPEAARLQLIECDGITWEALPAMSDEFVETNTLDTSKWLPRNPQWKGRPPGWFSPANVYVENGALKLTCRVEEPPKCESDEFKNFTTAYVQTHEKVCYGHFEIECIPANSVTSSSFWFTGNTPDLWNEIDVFELSQAPGHECLFHTNTHIFRYPGMNLEAPVSKQKTVHLPFNTCNSPMRVAFDWTPKFLTWIVNGEIVRQSENTNWHSPMHLQFDCETMPDWFGLPETDDPRLPATFQINYVRSWRRVENKE